MKNHSVFTSVCGRLSVLAIALLWLPLATHAQTLRNYVKAADEAYEQGAYEIALTNYKIAAEVDKKNPLYAFRAAESARMLSAHQVAETYYSQVADEARTGVLADANYGQALSNMYLANYDKAIALFDKYIAGGGSMAQFAKTQREHAVWANANRTKVKQEQAPVRMSEPHNTVFSDMSPVYHKGNVYTTSSWKASESDPYRLRIFEIKNNERVLLNIGGLDTNIDVANPAFSPDGQYLYCSVRNYKSAYKGFSLAVCTRQNDSSWGAPQMLEAEAMNGTQPSIGYDSVSRKSTLFFASDRLGGQGGSDIWSASIEGATMGSPTNLTAINTALDEVTPLFYTPFQTLFFSSNGHDNLGGFDMFSSQRLREFARPANIGAPFNSSYDDLYYFLDFEAGRSYFSSNRPGNMCADTSLDCQCNDIYESKFEVALQVNTFNSITSSKLDSVTMKLVNLTTGLEEKMEFNPKSNQFYFPLKFNQRYRLISSRGGEFTSDTTDFDTNRDLALGFSNGSSGKPGVANDGGGNAYTMMGSKTYTQNLYMKPAGLFLDVFVFDAISKQPLNASTIKLSQSTGAADSKTNSSSNDYSYLVKAGNTFKIEASRTGYSTDILEFSIPADVAAPRRIVKNVYLARAVDLPVSVYFENDYPDRRSKETSTTTVYADHYKFYKTLRATYVKEYGNAAEVESFFTNDVDAGYDRLNRVCQTLYEHLQQGYSLQVVFEGFASPRFDATYNQYLTQRRIASVLNHFKTWNGGVMARYIDSGKLRVTQQPNGSSLAPSTVNADLSNPKLSWYAPNAARERRVTIIDIRRQNGMLSIEYDGKNEIR
jgi:tetratricopeptide (TPR) repeat protein